MINLQELLDKKDLSPLWDNIPDLSKEYNLCNSRFKIIHFNCIGILCEKCPLLLKNRSLLSQYKPFKTMNYKLKETDLIGKIKDLPLHIAQKAYDNMKLQFPIKEVDYLQEAGIKGAFDWASSKEKVGF